MPCHHELPSGRLHGSYRETALWDIGRQLSWADCEYFWVQDWVQLEK